MKPKQVVTRRTPTPEHALIRSIQTDFSDGATRWTRTALITVEYVVPIDDAAGFVRALQNEAYSAHVNVDAPKERIEIDRSRSAGITVDEWSKLNLDLEKRR